MKIIQQADYRIFFDDVRMDPFIKSWTAQCGLNASDAQATVTMYRTKALEQWKGYLTQVRIFVRNVFSNKFSIVFEGELSNRSWAEQRNDVGTITFNCSGFYHWLDISLPLMIGSEDALDQVTRFRYEAMDINVDGVTKLFASNAQLMQNANPIQSIIDNLFQAVYAGYYSLSDSSFQWANLQKRFKVMADIITQFRNSGFLDAFTFTRTTNIQSFYVYLNQVLTQLMFEFYQDRDGALRIKNPSWADSILKAHILDESVVSNANGYNNWDNEPTRVLAIGGKVDVARTGDPTLSSGNILAVPMGLYIGGATPGQGQYFSQQVEVQMQQFGTAGAVNNGVSSASLSAMFKQCDDFIAGGTSAMVYVWGGGRDTTTWDAFVQKGQSDCSSFVMQMYKHFFNISMPSTSQTQWADMTGNTKVDKSALEPGDLVFFCDDGSGKPTHVGIYCGSDELYNMTQSGKPLEKDSLSSQWYTQYYTGAKRYDGVQASATSGQSANVPLTGRNSTEQIWYFFRGNDFGEQSTAGIMGNLFQESSFDPTSVNPSTKAFGLGQWLGGRLTGLYTYAKNTNGDPNSLLTQLNYMYQEIAGPNPEATFEQKISAHGGISALKNASIQNAVNWWEECYERSGGSAMGARFSNAEMFLRQLSGKQPPTGSGSTASGASTSAAVSNTLAQQTNKYLGTPYAGSGGYTFTTNVVGQADASQTNNYANTSLGTGAGGLPTVVEAAPKAVDPSQFSTSILKYPVPSSASTYQPYIVSRPNGINPNIICEIIESQSKWKEKYNNGNRMGLMGVPLAYAQATGLNPDLLYDPQTNIQEGTLLLSSGLKTFNNKLTFALATLYMGDLRPVEAATQSVNAVDFTKVRALLPSDCVQFVDSVVDKYCAMFGGNYLMDDPNKIFSGFGGKIKVDYANNTAVPDYTTSYKPILSDEEKLFKINLQIIEQLLIRYDIQNTSGSGTMNADELIQRYAKYMMQLLRAESHGITIQLSTSLPFLRPGFNCWLEPTRRDLVFYITGVQHQGSYQQGTTTSVNGEFIRDPASYDSIESNIFVSQMKTSVSDFGEVIKKSDMDSIRKQLDNLHNTADETIGDARKVPYLSQMYSSAVGKATDFSTSWEGEFSSDELDKAIASLYKGAPAIIVTRKNNLKKIMSDGASFFTSMLLYTPFQ